MHKEGAVRGEGSVSVLTGHGGRSGGRAARGNGEGSSPPFRFGTKAETLARLKPLVTKCRVPEMTLFCVRAWRKDPQALLRAIQTQFGRVQLAVRSSAAHEDGDGESLAGAFHSCLDVEGGDAEAIRVAIEAVIASYGGDSADQVLVQPMVRGAAYSGVIMTRDLDSGAPYYVLNYDDETGTTNRVTSGIGVSKTVIVHRDWRPEHLHSPRVSELLEMVQEIEALCGAGEPLDIEFAKASGTLYLLQVRRMAVQRHWDPETPARITQTLQHLEGYVVRRSGARSGVAGDRTILGQMPDWNPAEMIGSNPRPLATSLYRELITDRAWREARSRMGYREVPNEVLMVVLAGRPYIDVRNSFNSFLPAGLEARVEEKLINAWLDRLAMNPQLHDKVEFEIAQTVVDFTFHELFRARYPGVLTPPEYAQYHQRLQHLTQRNLSVEPSGSLWRARLATKRLESLQAQAHQLAAPGDVQLWQISEMLRECRELGTLPFAIIARHAFIAESLLRSMVGRGALRAERIDEFKQSLWTVTKALTLDWALVRQGELAASVFMGRYGHLRPGTYDVLSPRYDQRNDLFWANEGGHAATAPGQFGLTESERRALVELLGEMGYDRIAPDQLLRHAAEAIVGREHAKFVFTRHLSDVLELLAVWGAGHGLSRADLSYLEVADLLQSLSDPPVVGPARHFKALAERRQTEAGAALPVRLGYIIRDTRDLYVAPLQRSIPNFVTAERVSGPLVVLDTHSSVAGELDGRIVCIENADPGFDWVFTRRLAGLVTKYGGANSHMTIRCAELRIPAAIGVGEQTFERLVAAGYGELDCVERVVRPTCASHAAMGRSAGRERTECAGVAA